MDPEYEFNPETQCLEKRCKKIEYDPSLYDGSDGQELTTEIDEHDML